MGLRDEIEQSAQQTGAKAREISELKAEVEGLRDQVGDVKDEMSDVKERIGDARTRLGKMIGILKKVLKSFEVIETTDSILENLKGVGEKAKEARKALANVKWSGRIRMSVWAGTSVLIALILATAILWTSSRLNLHFLPQQLVLTEREQANMEFGRNYRKAYQGLTEEEREEINATLEAALMRVEEGSSQSSSAQGDSRSESAQGGSSR